MQRFVEKAQLCQSQRLPHYERVGNNETEAHGRAWTCLPHRASLVAICNRHGRHQFTVSRPDGLPYAAGILQSQLPLEGNEQPAEIRQVVSMRVATREFLCTDRRTDR